MNRVMRSLVLLSCLCTCIGALRFSPGFSPGVSPPGFSFYRHRKVNRDRVCRDKSHSCPQWAATGYCTSRNYASRMKSNCARSCGICSTNPTAPSIPAGFQIYSSGYGKCLTVHKGFSGINLYLSDCVGSASQTWRWTSGGKLQSSWNVWNQRSRCLTVQRVYRRNVGWQNIAVMQPCNARSSSIYNAQEWQCVGTGGGYLKLKNDNLYLVPFVYSGVKRNGGVLIRPSVTNSCLWRRYGSSKSLCQDVTSTSPPTSQVTTVPTAQITTVTPQSQWFQIKSSYYKKCLAKRDISKVPSNFRYFASVVTLEDCDRSSPAQFWQWTSNNQLQLKLNGKCLVTNVFRQLKFQQCTSVVNHQWSCTSQNHFISKSGWTWGYLTSFVYSGLPLGYDVRVRSNCIGSCGWTRLDGALSVCDKGKAKPTTLPLTTKRISTQATPPLPSTNVPATPPVPSTDGPATPPVPPTDDFATPPLPPTDDVFATPPIPSTDDYATPPAPPMTTKSPPPQGNKNIKCGTKGRVGVVVNGTVAAAGSWPWQVGIKKCPSCNITCGGTLINDEWVVTAAHCVSDSFPEDLDLVIGEVDQSRWSGHEQTFKCNKIIIHKEYAIDAPFDKDIALVRLDKYAVFNDHVRPLCMPRTGTALTDKDLCTVTGFGRDSQNGFKTAKLMQANVKVVPLKTCVKSYMQLLNPRKVTSNMLCAGYKRGGTDACHGDSGGPLSCFDRSNFRFILGGIVSWGVGCARPNLYGVYTNTAVFASWVQKELAEYGY